MTKYNKITPEIAEKLQAIVGTKRFFAKDAVKDDFSRDEMPIYGKYYPEVVCEVDSARRRYGTCRRLRAAVRRSCALHNSHEQNSFLRHE